MSQIIDPSFNRNAAESFINSLTWNNLTNKVTYGGGSSPESRTTIDYTKCERLEYKETPEGEKIYIGVNHYFEITETTRQWYEGSSNISRLLVLDDGQRNMSIQTRASFSGCGYADFVHQPKLIVLYRNTVGVEGCYDYHAKNIGRAGTASVNDFTLGLSLSVPVFSAPSQASPFCLSLTYNSPISNTSFTNGGWLHTANYSTSSTGNGWKTSVQQSVVSTSFVGSNGSNETWLIYTDADGTEHYFSKKEGATAVYEDEDGLGLTITVGSNGKHTMTDKETNEWTFYYGYLTSYVDHNGNALYFAYNGQDYSSGTSWRPTSSGTVYRVTSVWRKNNGGGNAAKLLTLDYTSNKLTSIVDAANRTTRFSYDSNGDLIQITYPDNQTASYTYDTMSIMDLQTGTSRTFYRLRKARDDESQYEIRYTYAIGTALRVYTIQEYAGAVGSEEAGASLRGFKSGPVYTRFRYSGADNTFGTEDDVVAQYRFDRWGHTVNAATFNSDESAILGVSAGIYKQNHKTEKDNNRLFHAAASGLQSINLLNNSGMEYGSSLTDSGWNKTGNGDAAVATTSNTTSTAEVTPHTGGKMLKLYLGTSADKETCYQTEYLEADKTYVFSAYVNTAPVSNLRSGGVYLSFRSSSGTDVAVSRTLNYRTNVLEDDEWEQLDVTYTPTSSGSYQVAVNLDHMSKVIVADDLQLETVPNLRGSESDPESTASNANLLQFGGLEYKNPTQSGAYQDSKVWEYWSRNYSSYSSLVEESGPNGSPSKVIKLNNAPERRVRIEQDVPINKSGK